MDGIHGRLLRVDLGSRTSEIEPLPEIVSQRLLGGVGLASYLLYCLCPAGLDPLSPENPLIFTSSPFIGTGITTASQIAIATKSPQTGMIGDSLSSSYLALALKRAGFDALAITGRAAAPSVLVIDGDRVRYLPARHLLGLDPAATSDAVRAEVGKGFRVAAIGVAGERGVRYASISNDGRLAGRSGTGAVMGSKNLKAVAIRGHTLPAVARPIELARAARELAARSLGPGTAKYREIGIAANVSFFNRLGFLPTGTSRPVVLKRLRRSAARPCFSNTAPTSTAARPARSAASTTIARRITGRKKTCVWSTIPCSRSARCAASVNPTQSFESPPSAMNWESTRSAPEPR